MFWLPQAPSADRTHVTLVAATLLPLELTHPGQ